MLAILFLTAVIAPVAQEPGSSQEPPAAQEPAAPPQEPVAVSVEPPTGTTAAAQPFIDAGLAHFKKRRFARAEAEFQRAVEADPSSAAAHFYLGYAQYKQVEPKRPFHPGKQEAAAHFAKAYELDPTFKPVWYMNR